MHYQYQADFMRWTFITLLNFLVVAMTFAESEIILSVPTPTKTPTPIISARELPTCSPTPTETPEWVEAKGRYFIFPASTPGIPDALLPLGFLENINASPLKYLIPDRTIYNAATPRAYLNRYDLHNVSVIRVFMESPFDSEIEPSFGYPFFFEDSAGSSECRGEYPNYYWELTVDDLIIRTQYGKIYYNANRRVKNLLLTSIPTPDLSNFRVTANISFDPGAQQWEFCSLLIYQNIDNYLRVSRDQNGVTFCREINGKYPECYSESIPDPVPTSIYLQIEKDGYQYTGKFSLDNNNWVEIHTFNGFKSLIEDPSGPVSTPTPIFYETYLRTGISAWTDNQSVPEGNPAYFHSFKIEDTTSTPVTIFFDDFNQFQLGAAWSWYSYYPASVAFWDNLIDVIENETQNIYLILTPWDTWSTFQMRWEVSPYNFRVGGPCQDRDQFMSGGGFDCFDCRKAARDRFKFIIDRWGRSPRILGWEILNEADNRYFWDNISPPVLTDWINYMFDASEGLKSFESNKYGRNHLWSISTAACLPDSGFADIVFNNPEFDFSMTHFYFCKDVPPWTIADPCIGGPQDGVDVVNPALEVNNGIKYALEHIMTPKPFLDGENGPIDLYNTSIDECCDLNPSQTCDNKYFHNMIWAHLSSGGTGSGIRHPYRDGYLLTDEMIDSYNAMANIASEIDWGDFDSQNYDHWIFSDVSSIHTMSCSDGDQALIWILKENPEFHETTIHFSNFHARNHNIQWFDDSTGYAISSPTPIIASSSFDVVSPSFNKSIVGIVNSYGYTVPLKMPILIILFALFTIIFWVKR